MRVYLLGANGTVIPYQGEVAARTLRVIPAGQNFYLGGFSSLIGDVDVRGVRADVTVGSTVPERYGLPTVSDVRVNAKTGEITATVTNPFKVTISPYDYAADVVVYDRQVRVIGGGESGQIGGLLNASNITPGAHTSVSFSSPMASGARVASARITVFPL